MNRVTQVGLDRLRSKLTRHEASLAELLVEKGEAAEVGGNQWHDNAAFEHYEAQERLLRGRIQRLNLLLERAVVVSAAGASETVSIGTTVLIERHDGTHETWTIGGHGEFDPAVGVIAYDSPLGGSLLGGAEGDTRVFHVGGRDHVIRIVRLGEGGA